MGANSKPSHVSPGIDDPVIHLKNDIRNQFESEADVTWRFAKSHGATSVLPDDKARTSYPKPLRDKCPYGAIAQRKIEGFGYWDFGVEPEGTEFKLYSYINDPDGRRIRHSDTYRVIMGLGPEILENYRARCRN
ncbi:MAG: hypothetical protein JXC85_01350 [Candidatus Aenigmarchaeota archaeon]|nr:hypothetical protein [Candidatus Aenigmarchaeota archaeon]